MSGIEISSSQGLKKPPKMSPREEKAYLPRAAGPREVSFFFPRAYFKVFYNPRDEEISIPDINGHSENLFLFEFIYVQNLFFSVKSSCALAPGGKWPDAIILRNEDWKFLHDRRSREWRNLKFPMSQERYIQISPCWHSRHGETLFPHKRLHRLWGNNFLPYLLCHKWGNLNVPWLTSREFYQSSFLKMIASTFPINKM